MELPPLDRLRREREGNLSERLFEIGKNCAKRLNEPIKWIDHSEFLYDDKGLPK